MVEAAFLMSAQLISLNIESMLKLAYTQPFTFFSPSVKTVKRTNSINPRCMKKTITLSCCLLMVTGLLLGQSKWSFGAAVHAGYSGTSDNHRNYYPSPQFGDYETVNSQKFQPTMGVGLWLERRLGKHWGLAAGVDYLLMSSFSRHEAMSYNLEGSMIFYSEEDRTRQQHQLQIPLEVHFYLGKESNKWRPFISTGVQVQYLLNEETIVESFYGGSAQISSSSLRIQELDYEYLGYPRMQFGVNVGLGIASDQMSLTLRRTQSVGNDANYFSYNCAYCVDDIYYYGYYYPTSNSSLQSQLTQTSLRFAYRLR